MQLSTNIISLYIKKKKKKSHFHTLVYKELYSTRRSDVRTTDGVFLYFFAQDRGGFVFYHFVFAGRPCAPKQGSKQSGTL